MAKNYDGLMAAKELTLAANSISQLDWTVNHQNETGTVYFLEKQRLGKNLVRIHEWELRSCNSKVRLRTNYALRQPGTAAPVLCC